MPISGAGPSQPGRVPGVRITSAERRAAVADYVFASRYAQPMRDAKRLETFAEAIGRVRAMHHRYFMQRLGRRVPARLPREISSLTTEDERLLAESLGGRSLREIMNAAFSAAAENASCPACAHSNTGDEHSSAITHTSSTAPSRTSIASSFSAAFYSFCSAAAGSDSPCNATTWSGCPRFPPARTERPIAIGSSIPPRLGQCAARAPRQRLRRPARCFLQRPDRRPARASVRALPRGANPAGCRWPPASADRGLRHRYVRRVGRPRSRGPACCDDLPVFGR